MKFAVTKRTGVSPLLWLTLTALYFASLDATAAVRNYDGKTLLWAHSLLFLPVSSRLDRGTRSQGQ